jgi:hypothetical protein
MLRWYITISQRLLKFKRGFVVYWVISFRLLRKIIGPLSEILLIARLDWIRLNATPPWSEVNRISCFRIF